MRGIYSVRFSGTITTAKTLIQIKAASALEILRMSITQTSTETSDTAEAQILRKTVAATVTSFTPLLWATNDQAAKAVGGTAATGHTASAEGTDGDILVAEGFNVLAGWTWLPTPEERMSLESGEFIALKSAITIASSTLIGLIVFRELN